MASKDSFILYQRYEAQLELLTMEQRGELFTAIFVYNGTGTVPEISDAAVKMALMFITEQIDHDKGRYAKKCEKNAANIAKRWGKAEKGEETDENMPKTSVEMHKNDLKSDTNVFSEDTNVYERIPSDTNGIPNDTKRYLSDSESESDSDSDSEREINLSPHARAREKRSRSKKNGGKVYGRYGNVILTRAEYDNLSREFPDLEHRIERLSEYIASTGKVYENHCATIRAWSKNGLDDKARAADSPRTHGDFDGDEFFEAALARSRQYLEKEKLEHQG